MSPHPLRRRIDPSSPSRPLAVLVLAAAVQLLGCARPTTHHPAVGMRVARLPIESIADPDRPAPPLLGRVTLLNFWGTWCPPCRRELPGLVRIATRLTNDPRFQLVAVSCGSGGTDDRDDIARDTSGFLERAGLTLEAWCDPSGLTRTIFASAYGFEAFPTTYLVGHDGKILRVWSGYAGRDEAEIATALVEALKNCPPTPAPGGDFLEPAPAAR